MTAFNPSSTMMAFRRYSIESYERLGVFQGVGSLRLASSRAQLGELQRTASRARGIGLDAEVIGPGEARSLMPAISPDELYGAVHLAADGHLDPHEATHAVADAARALGVRIRQSVRVTGFELTRDRAIRRVLTDAGPIDTEVVVNAAGMWAPRVAAMVGAWLPSTPVDHQHIALKEVPGHELPRDMPCFRDPDNLVYGKSESGGMVFGGYELDPVSRWEDGVPWEHAARSLPPDFERFGPLMTGAVRRFPFLADAEVVRLVCHPDAMTPDANPLLGPWPGRPRILDRGRDVAQRLRGCGGIGRAMAGWITAGDPGAGRRAVPGVAVRRHVPGSGLRRRAGPRGIQRLLPIALPVRRRHIGTSASTVAAARSSAGGGRGLRHEGRLGARRSPRTGPAVAAGRSRPGGVRLDPAAMVRAGRATRVCAVRERVGLIDLSSFGKIDVRGPARPVAAPAGRRQRPRQVARERRVHAVVRRARRDGRRRHDHAARGGPPPRRDRRRVRGLRPRVAALARATRRGRRRGATSAATYATIGLWGPRARDVLAAATGDATAVDDACPAPSRGARDRGRGGVRPRRAHQLCRRAWLGADRRCRSAVEVWDAIVGRGCQHGWSPSAIGRSTGLRMEKGYRYFSADMTMLETPFEAGSRRVRPPREGAVRGPRCARRVPGARTGGSNALRRLSRPS